MQAKMLMLLAAMLPIAASNASQTPTLGGRYLMWAEAISKDCEIPPEIEFSTDGKMSGSTACNTLSGEFTQQGDKVDFSKAVTTKRACGPKLMEVENRFMSKLTAAKTVLFDGDKVILSDGNGATLMTLVPMKPGSCD